ncbi:MAG: thiol reductant ABC exporter subunit CydD [Bacteroidota bacterium]
MISAVEFLKANRNLARRPLNLAAICAALGALLLIGQYWLLASVLDDVVFGQAGLDVLWPRLYGMLAVIFVRAILAWLAERSAVAAASAVKQGVRDSLLCHLFALGPVRLAGERTGDLAALLVDGVEALEPYYARFLPAITTVAVVPLAILVVIAPQDWISGAVLALTAPLIPLFMILIGKGAERLNQRQWARLARMSAHFLEVIQNLTTLKLFNASRREADIIAKVSEDYRLATMSVLRVAFLSALALEFLATVSIAMVAVFIGFRLLSGTMDYQHGLFILLLAPEFYLPLRSLGANYHARMEAIGAATRMVEILERPIASAMAVSEGHPPPAGPVAFENIHLTYPGGRVALVGVNLRLEPGTVTALVGPSGAGKTSIVSLLLGFVAPDRGHILVGQVDLSDIAVEAWRQYVAWVPQRPMLFRGTIADNIRLGTEASDEQVRAAARLTGADTWIGALTDGYGHVVGERGSGVSGGQARLIALTRAALRDAPLLILDEATASLDRASERQVNQAILRLAERRTVLAIAHRLETARLADTIAVIEAGRVVETGHHDALVARGGAYARLLRGGETLIGGEG